MSPELLRRGVVEPTDSTQTLRKGSFPLGVKCRFCLARALISKEELEQRFPQPRLLSSLKFRCKRCGRHEVDLHTFWSPGSVKRFLRSDD
jgi:hypothetical protein